MSRYPWDPQGPVGPQYPDGSGVFLLMFVLALVALVLLTSGCSDSSRVADSVNLHCRETSNTPAQFHKCMADSIWVLDAIEGNH